MTINPNSYIRTLMAMKPAMLNINIDEDPRLSTLTLLSIGSHVPFIVILAYAMRNDVLGHSDQLQYLFNTTKSFYKYDHIESWEDLK